MAVAFGNPGVNAMNPLCYLRRGRVGLMHKLPHLGLASFHEFHCLVRVLFGKFDGEWEYDGIRLWTSEQDKYTGRRFYASIPKISCEAYATYSAAIRRDWQQFSFPQHCLPCCILRRKSFLSISCSDLCVMIDTCMTYGSQENVNRT